MTIILTKNLDNNFDNNLDNNLDNKIDNNDIVENFDNVGDVFNTDEQI